MLEAQRERLRVLADSVNETARMARTTSSLFLLVALYLTLTLLSTTDENLLLNGQVILPQIGTGISVVESYVLAPPVFLFLHGQALLLLVVLARKVRTFEAVLMDEFPDTAFDVQAKRKECRDWLSAFPLVQAFRQDTGLSTMSRVLTWLTTGAIPVALLFAIDLSFVRYQSVGITQVHHLICFVDLVLVIWFDRRVFAGESTTNWRRLPTLTKYLPALLVLMLLFWFARPPNGNEDSSVIWTDDRESVVAQPFLDHPRSPKNPLDAGPCKWWGMACRYLDVSHLEIRPRSVIDDDDQDRNPRVSVPKIDLSERNLRFARLPHAQLQGANLRYAQLQGADFQNAQLQGADFHRTQLQGANLEDAQLQDAVLSSANLSQALLYKAQLQGANLRKTKLNKASLHRARLQGAFLDSAQLQEAYLIYTHLQGADLSSANLSGANLNEAQLQGANLSTAILDGAILSEVQLQGAKLQGASLRGADLVGVRLEGASFDMAVLGGTNIRSAGLLCSEGKPADWHLAWMPGLTYELSKLGVSKPEDESEEAIERLMNKLIIDDVGIINIPHEPYTIRDHLKNQFENCPERPFSGARPTKMDLVVHSGNPLNSFRAWPTSATTNEAYWEVWSDWTKEFACENEYNARSSMRRWSDVEHWFGKEFNYSAANIVRKSLIVARTNADDCPGLSAIPEDDKKWRSFVKE